MVCPLIVPRTPQTSTLASVDSDGFRVGRCRASCRSQSIAATRESWLCAQRSHTEDIEATCEQEDIREEKESCAGCNESQEETTTVSHCTRDILVDLQTFWQQAIRLRTECSGLESVMVALNMMTSRTELKFICEKGSGCTSADLGTHIPETCLRGHYYASS